MVKIVQISLKSPTKTTGSEKLRHKMRKLVEQ